MPGFEIFSLGDVVLQSGSTLWQARLAYKTYGSLNDARDNVVLIPSIWGHAAGRGTNPSDNRFIDVALNDLLEGVT